MPDAPVSRAVPRRGPVARMLLTGLLIGVVDGCWAIVLTILYHGTITRLFQRIAATPFGATMYDGGGATVALGVAIHFLVALTWSAVFLLLVTKAPWLRRTLESRYGVLKVAAIYGPCIWIVMSAVVIPLFMHQPVAITVRWWIQIAGHIVFVGLPIVWGIASTQPAAARGGGA